MAHDVAKKIEAKLVLGEFNIKKAGDSCPSFKKCAENWFNLPHDWRESTLISYKSNLDKHIYPVFEKQKLDTIKRKDLKEFFDSLLIKGMASGTLAGVRRVVSGVLSYAVESELIENNPLHGIKIKYKSKQFEGDPLTEEEMFKLLEQAKKFVGGAYYPPILCKSRTGLRIGELQALQWGNIDFKGRFIEVKRSWRNGRLTATKNKKRRRVDMSPHLTETLNELGVIQKKRALRDGRPLSDWVFANEKGEMLHRESFRNALNRCLELADLRCVRIHDLRHSYATIRLLRGHNVAHVSYQLGHSSIKITYDVYGHWIPGKFKSEVDELDTLQLDATYTQPEHTNSPILKSFQ